MTKVVKLDTNRGAATLLHKLSTRFNDIEDIRTHIKENLIEVETETTDNKRRREYAEVALALISVEDKKRAIRNLESATTLHDVYEYWTMQGTSLEALHEVEEHILALAHRLLRTYREEESFVLQEHEIWDDLDVYFGTLFLVKGMNTRLADVE